MLGRKPKGDAAAARLSPSAGKKRKWQKLSEESDEDKGEQITKEEFDKWKETLAEEERREQMEREEQDRKAREDERRRREMEEEERLKREKEEANAKKEARKAAEEAEQVRRRQEEDLIPPGAHPPDVLGLMPPGLKPDKAHLYKTSFCKRWEQGNCNFGSACHFAHGERELRGRVAQMGVPPLVAMAGASAHWDTTPFHCETLGIWSGCYYPASRPPLPCPDRWLSGMAPCAGPCGPCAPFGPCGACGFGPGLASVFRGDSGSGFGPVPSNGVGEAWNWGAE
ncbi:unnamed protein product [Effrenium voratum]|uniref:C3H1-type domain-containing protein n=1 Tax=Effrenium voratum TaxID=2562239 RepID=A0AA36NJA5_9DINO|nr:unnamed protein product [Effrenium voratum]